MPIPADFHAFWHASRAKLAETPLETTLTPAPEHSTGEMLVFHLAIKSFEGQTIHGWYAAPPVPSGVRLAGLLWLPGYGQMPDVSRAMEWASQGFATLALVPRGQGDAPFPEGSRGKLAHGVTDAHRYAYRSVYMDCLRGLAFVRAQPEVHPEKIVLAGGSQGGGLALVTAALADVPIAAVAAHVPYLCLFDWRIERAGVAGPDDELTRYLGEHPEQRATVRRTLAYFDVAHHVEQIACPVLMTAGGKDVVCPRETIEAAFERVPTTKSLLYEPAMGHEWLPDTLDHMRSWLIHYVG